MNGTTTIDVTKPMSRREVDRYNDLKKLVVDTIAASFVEVGKALTEIKQGMLYRSEFKTFEQCCQQLFDIGRHRAGQLIDASGVYGDLLTICQQNRDGESDIVIDVLPVNEAQIRPLLKVPPADRPKVWAAAIETARKIGKPSSGHVNKLVKQYLGEEIEARITRTSARVQESRKMGAEIKGIFQQLFDEIRTIRTEGYKVTSRLALVQHLDAARSIVSEDGDTIAEKKVERSNRERLMRAGYAFIRIDRVKGCIMIEDRTGTGWQVLATPGSDVIDTIFWELIRENETYLAD